MKAALADGMGNSGYRCTVLSLHELGSKLLLAASEIGKQVPLATLQQAEGLIEQNLNLKKTWGEKKKTQLITPHFIAREVARDMWEAGLVLSADKIGTLGGGTKRGFAVHNSRRAKRGLAAQNVTEAASAFGITEIRASAELCEYHKIAKRFTFGLHAKMVYAPYERRSSGR